MNLAGLWVAHSRTTHWVKELGLSLVTTRMSRFAFHLDYFIYPPLILLSLAYAAAKSPPLMLLLQLALGFVAWTLAEYMLHRFVLHDWPYFAKYHQAHHDEPRAMIGAPTLFTVLFFFAVAFLPLWPWRGSGEAAAFLSGFLSGYVAFAAVHEMTHHSQSQTRLIRHFKKLHAIHHHGDTNKNFGVLTTFWDRVFGTYAATAKKAKGA